MSRHEIPQRRACRLTGIAHEAACRDRVPDDQMVRQRMRNLAGSASAVRQLADRSPAGRRRHPNEPQDAAPPLRRRRSAGEASAWPQAGTAEVDFQDCPQAASRRPVASASGRRTEACKPYDLVLPPAGPCFRRLARGCAHGAAARRRVLSGSWASGGPANCGRRATCQRQGPKILDWRRGRVAEGSGLLNRRTPKGVPGVRIPPSPPATPQTRILQPKQYTSELVPERMLPRCAPTLCSHGLVLVGCGGLGTGWARWS